MSEHVYITNREQGLDAGPTTPQGGRVGEDQAWVEAHAMRQDMDQALAAKKRGEFVLAELTRADWRNRDHTKQPGYLERELEKERDREASHRRQAVGQAYWAGRAYETEHSPSGNGSGAKEQTDSTTQEQQSSPQLGLSIEEARELFSIKKDRELERVKGGSHAISDEEKKALVWQGLDAEAAGAGSPKELEAKIKAELDALYGGSRMTKHDELIARTLEEALKVIGSEAMPHDVESARAMLELERQHKQRQETDQKPETTASSEAEDGSLSPELLAQIPDDPEERKKFFDDVLASEFDRAKIPLWAAYLAKRVRALASQVPENARYPGTSFGVIGNSQSEYLRAALSYMSGRVIEREELGQIPFSEIAKTFGFDVKKVVPDYEQRFNEDMLRSPRS